VREYELNFIIQPEISEEGSKVILDRLDAILAASNGERLLCDDLGKRKLSYEIRKFQKGHYYVLSFLDDGTTVPDLERALRLDESVLRYLTVKVSDVVTDVEGRKAEAKEREIELHRRAAEKSAREAEEAKARADAERTAAAEASAVSDDDDDDDDDDSDDASDDDDDDDDDDEEDDR
jgi:small subunit ribosomal protein S6